MSDTEPMANANREAIAGTVGGDGPSKTRPHEPLSVDARTNAFDNDLDDRLRGLSEPRAVMRAACEMLGQYLAADRVGYAEADPTGELLFVYETWAKSGLNNGAGAHRGEDFGRLLMAALRAGRAVGIDDVLTHPMTAQDDVARATCRAGDIRALINVPLVVDDRLLALLFVHNRVPRPWTDTERKIVKAVIDRTDQAVRHARRQAILQRSEAKFQAAEEGSIDGFMGFASLRNAKGEIKDFRWTNINGAAANAVGRQVNLLLGRRLLQELPDKRVNGAFDAYVKVAETGEPWTAERSYRQDGIDRIFRTVAVKTPAGLNVWFTDITDQRRAETRLRESEQRFRAAVDAVQGILWTNDAEGRMVGDQPGWEALTGQTADAYQGFGWSAALHPDDAAPTLTAWHAAVTEKRPFAFEHRVRRRDGSWGEYSVRAVPTFDAAGTITQWVGVHTDVTERRVAERALARQTRQLQGVIDTVPAAIWFTQNQDARKIVGNRYAAELWRESQPSDDGSLDPETALAGGYRYFRDGRPAGIEAIPLNRAARGDQVTGEEFTLQFNDGAAAIIEVHANPLHDDAGSLAGAVCVAVDVTARKAIEENLRRSEEEFRTLADNQANMCWMADPGGSVYWFNRRWTEYAGVAPDDVKGWNWGSVVEPKTLPKVMALWRKALATGTPVETTFAMRRHDGHYREFLTRVEPLRDGSGNIVRWFGSNVDVHRQKLAERALRASRNALRKLNQQLEQRVLHEISAKQEAQSLLWHAQRMEALGQLAGGVAHDFNNVLQAMSGGLSLIEQRADDPKMVKKIARMAAEAGKRGAAITNRLLAFSRSGELRADRVEAVDLLEPLREMLNATLDRNLTIELRIAPDAPPLLADKAQLETVLINLAVNARDAMSDGGVLVLGWVAETVAGEGVHPAGLAQGAYVRLDIVDTGVGMDADTLRRASEPFFTTKPVGQGTGLGLPMARGFAEQSGGGLSISSRPGAGTRVSLWFPQSGADAPAEAAESFVPWPEKHKGRAMVVDDDPIVLRVLAQQLEGLGFDTQKASSGLEALRQLESGADPQILIADYAMPGMNGLMLMEEVRRRRPRLPVLLLTGFVENDVLANLESAQDAATALLRKPVSQDVLARSAAALLDGAAGS